jgi:hypothetical protein
MEALGISSGRTNSIGGIGLCTSFVGSWLRGKSQGPHLLVERHHIWSSTSGDDKTDAGLLPSTPSIYVCYPPTFLGFLQCCEVGNEEDGSERGVRRRRTSTNSFTVDEPPGPGMGFCSAALQNNAVANLGSLHERT